MRFSDFIDEAPPPRAASDTPVSVSTVATPGPAHQHVLGPPPNPGEVSAFAELFGAGPEPSTQTLPPPPAPPVPRSVEPALVAAVPQAVVELQAAVDALIVPRDIVAPIALVPEATEVPLNDVSATLRALEASRAEELAPINNEMVIDDDLLPQRGARTASAHPTRAWSRGRSKR